MDLFQLILSEISVRERLMHLMGSLAVWDSVPTATGTAFQMLQLLVHREVGKIHESAAELAAGFLVDKLNAMQKKQGDLFLRLQH